VLDDVDGEETGLFDEREGVGLTLETLTGGEPETDHAPGDLDLLVVVADLGDLTG
jgi:hypothetical protein